MQRLTFNVHLHCESCGKLEDNLTDSLGYGTQSHNVLDTIPLRPLPHRLNSKTNQVKRRGLFHQWTYVLFAPDCGVNGAQSRSSESKRSELPQHGHRSADAHIMRAEITKPSKAESQECRKACLGSFAVHPSEHSNSLSKAPVTMESEHCSQGVVHRRGRIQIRRWM